MDNEAPAAVEVPPAAPVEAPVEDNAIQSAPAEAAAAPAPVEEPKVDEHMPPAEDVPAPEVAPEEPEKMNVDEPANPEEEKEEEPKQEAPKSAAKKTPVKKTPTKAKTTPKKPAAAAAVAGGEGRVRRERKTVERFEVAAPKEEEAPMAQGSGTKLRDIPNVAFKMSKITGKDELMETLHNVMYRRKGQASTRKKGILDFCGFAFAGDQEEKEVEARKTSLSKVKLDIIHKMMDVLDLQRGSGDKSAKVDRIMDFLAKPTAQSDVDLAAKDAAKKEKARRKREREAKKKTATKKKAAPKTKKAKREGGDEGGEEEEDDDASSSDEEASDFEEEEAMPTKKERGGAASAKKEKSVVEEEEETAAEDPAAGLSAEQLKSDIETYLSKMNDEELSAVTRKTVMAAMEKQYGFELRSRKAEVKEAAQLYAEQRLGAAASPAGAAAAVEAGVPEVAAAIATEETTNGEGEDA